MKHIEIYIQKNCLLFLATFEPADEGPRVYNSFRSVLPVNAPNASIADMVIEAGLFEEKDPVFLQEAAIIQRAIRVAEGREAATKAVNLKDEVAAKLAGEKKWGIFYKKSELVDIHWAEDSILISFWRRSRGFYVGDSKRSIKIPISQMEDIRGIDFRAYLQPSIDKFA